MNGVLAGSWLAVTGASYCKKSKLRTCPTSEPQPWPSILYFKASSWWDYIFMYFQRGFRCWWCIWWLWDSCRIIPTSDTFHVGICWLSLIIQDELFLVCGMMSNIWSPGHPVYYIRRLSILFKSSPCFDFVCRFRRLPDDWASNNS